MILLTFQIFFVIFLFFFAFSHGAVVVDHIPDSLNALAEFAQLKTINCYVLNAYYCYRIRTAVHLVHTWIKTTTMG